MAPLCPEPPPVAQPRAWSGRGIVRSDLLQVPESEGPRPTPPSGSAIASCEMPVSAAYDPPVTKLRS